jgi:tetratricopeptide (TPR) repeat protein
MLLGQALAKQGKRTEGVREYMKGMELLFPGMASKEMAKMLEEHPAFQQPDATKAPNGYLAEVHFGKGLHLYWSRQYPQAEAHFKQAVGYFGQDARYQYFLGLAQLAQKTKLKRDAAYYSFEQGARLEAANQPPVSEINTSLERVQGDLRRLINTFRSKAVELTN